jgi:methyl-accepting chemotaxis protein
LSKLTSNVRNASVQLSQTVGKIHQIILTVDKKVSAGLSQTEMVVVAVTELDATVQEVLANFLGTADKAQSAHDAAIKADFLVNEANASLANFVNK